MQNYIDDDNEAEETLSFCDLPLHNDAAGSEEHPLQHQTSLSSLSSSSSSFDQDLFEFFTGERRSASSNIAPDNILFCGKLIPSKRHIPRIEFSISHSQTTLQKNISFFRRNSDSCFYKRTSKSVLSSNATTPRSNSLPFPINTNQTGKSGGKNDVLPKKVSLWTSSPTKSRWFVFMFGMSSLPKKMELSDLRNRQSRRCSPPPTMFQSDGSDDKELVGGGHRANTACKSSFGCFGGL